MCAANWKICLTVDHKFILDPKWMWTILHQCVKFWMMLDDSNND
jgi:hypothetical protein